MWNKIKRLMQGTYISKQERNARLMIELDKFMAENGESLTSMYERFSTLINVMDQNKLTPREISINTKLLKSLQPDQFEPQVKASKAKKAIRNHDPLSLVTNSQASPSYSQSPQPYYVTHPSFVIDNDDDYQGEIKGDAQEDKLSTAMMLLVNDFMLDNACGDNTLEELNAAVIMMTRIQPTDDKSDAEPT
nr:hypothetical protein [Tanacetum cinerariifolium]